MHNDLKDSIKARLYDMKYTPFLASYVFFFVYFNAKLFLIFFDPNMTTNDKIEMLSYDDVRHWKPIVGALLYTLIFPIAQAGFYYVTLQYRRLMNFIQQKIQDKTPLLQKRANEILRENADLQLELDKKIEELDTVKKRFETKEQNLIKKYEEKTKELESTFEDRVAKDTEKLKSELIEAQKKVADRGGEIEQLKKQVGNLETKVNQPMKYVSTLSSGQPKIGLEKMVDDAKNKQHEEFQRLITSLEDDEKTILKIIYENNISSSSKEQYIQKILQNNSFKRVKVESILKEFENKGIINLSNIGYYDTTEKGKKIMLELFDGK